MEEIDFKNIKSLDKESRYKTVIEIAERISEGEIDMIANMANISSILKYSFDNYVRVGFYLFDKTHNQLILGPFQGKITCTRINLGKGVCGTSAEKRKTIIVQDVDKFPGRIFCDSESKSEIVIPIVHNEYLIGVLDIDSDIYSAFDNIDKEYLELLVDKIKNIFSSV